MLGDLVLLPPTEHGLEVAGELAFFQFEKTKRCFKSAIRVMVCSSWLTGVIPATPRALYLLARVKSLRYP